MCKNELSTRILEEVDRSDNHIRRASTTFEAVNLPKLELAFADGKGEVRARYVP